MMALYTYVAFCKNIRTRTEAFNNSKMNESERGG